MSRSAWASCWRQRSGKASGARAIISAESFERINDYRHKVYGGEDYKEGIRSFLEKRPPQYKGKASDLD